MCGINGFFFKNDISSSITQDCINAMNHEIFHRGPNDSGFYIDDKNSLALGMQRLSIIDIESGSQPMLSNDKNLVIVFNGEIYNYLELRKKLIMNKNVSFKTNSDTEVILLGYQVWGKKIFSKLNGMFSIAIYDKKNKNIILARDRTGEKPLYYYKLHDNMVFSSELKAIKVFLKKNLYKKPCISKIGLNLYFSLTYIPSPYTIYDNIYKLEPGSFMEIDLDTFNFKVNNYWNASFDNNLIIEDYSYAKEKIRDLVYDSVEKRMRCDVPYGAFLSGGVDSSIITAVMADLKSNEKIKTFSIISSNKKFDESERSNSVSDYCNTDHYPILLDIDSIKNNIDKIILNYDEPFADSSALPTYFVSKVTKEKVTVALTGDGGDEVFGGYNRYKMNEYANLYQKYVPFFLHNKIVKPLINSYNLKKDDRGVLFRSKKFINAFSNSEYQNIVNIMSLGFEKKSLKYYLKNKWIDTEFDDLIKSHYSYVKNTSTLKKARYLDLKISLDGDMLTKVDRSSMLNSLECRSPFLDHRLIEFTNKLPDNFLMSNGKSKKILKETFQNMLPDGLFELEKSGFGIPVGDWLRSSLKQDLISLSKKAYLKDQDIFNEKSIKKLVYEHINCISDSTFKVWTFYCFQKWYNKNYEL